MAVHVIFILLLFITYYKTGGIDGEKNQMIRKRQVTYMGLLLFFFAALRSPVVGIDVLGDGVSGYWADYSIDAETSFLELLFMRAGRDPVFHFLLKVLSLFSDSPQTMLIVVGGIFAFGFSYFVYHSKGNVLLTFMMLIGFRIFSFSLSGIRQAVALGLIYIAYIAFRDKKYKQYVILTFIATLFHKSALVFFITWPLLFVSVTYVVYALIFLLMLNLGTSGKIVGFLGSIFFSGRFDSYLERSEDMVFEGGATFFIYIFFYLLILMSYRQIKRKDVTFDKEFSILSVGIFFSTIGQSMDNVFRIAYYFIFLLFPATSQMIISIVKDKKSYSFYCFLASALLALQYLLLGPGAGTENYDFFWNY